jgi:hypothetical protein
MTRRSFGTIGHAGFDGGVGLAMAAMLGVIAHTKPRAPRPLTPSEIAARDKRSERQRWNDEVDARKASKQMAKAGQP